MSGCFENREDDCDSEGEERKTEKGSMKMEVEKETKSAAVGSNRSPTATASATLTKSSVDSKKSAAELASVAAAPETKPKGVPGEDGKTISTEDCSSIRGLRDKADLDGESGEGGGTRLDPQIDERERDTGRLCRLGQDRAEDNGQTQETQTQRPGVAVGQGDPSEDAKGNQSEHLLSGNILSFSYSHICIFS